MTMFMLVLTVLLDVNAVLLRYKHFAQLWNLLHGELSLTMEESLLASGGADKENKSISNACEAKLSQFPALPPRVSVKLCIA